MKTLLLLRHAKSDWDVPADGDHARPLAKRGRKAARRMGRFIGAAGLVPDRVLTSTALRAQDTLDVAAAEGRWDDVPVQPTDALYEAGPTDVLALIQAQADAGPEGAPVDALLLVGHEPTFSAVVGRLAGGARVDMTTAALAQLEVDVDRWADVSFGTATLTLFVTPRALDGLKLKKAHLADEDDGDAGGADVEGDGGDGTGGGGA